MALNSLLSVARTLVMHLNMLCRTSVALTRSLPPFVLPLASQGWLLLTLDLERGGSFGEESFGGDQKPDRDNMLGKRCSTRSTVR